MDAFEFVAALVDALAWPLTVVTLAILFRRGLSSLIPGLTRLKWKDLEVEFKQQLVEIARTADAAELPAAGAPTDRLPALPPPTATAATATTFENEIEAVAEVSPRASIPLAWAAVENELLATVTRLLPDVRPSNSAHQHIRQLQNAGIIGHNTVATLTRMRDLRNRVAHGDLEGLPLSREDALEYSRLAQKIIAKLRGVSDEPRGDRF